MLSSLPKLADKAFVLGFFLPTLLFVLSILALFADQDWTKAVWDGATQKDGWDKLAYFILGVWGLSALLMMANHSLLQMLEGYYGPLAIVPRFRRREAERFKSKKDRYDALNQESVRAGDNFSQERRIELNRARRELITAFPRKPHLQLPTRFGNAIRAFESYSRDVYGADSIPLWLHLSAVIPKEFNATLEDARTQVNCVANVCVFGAMAALVAFGRFAVGLDWTAISSNAPCCGIPAMFHLKNAIFLGATLAAIAVSRLAYNFLIPLVYAWGNLVKAAFDCYLPALAEKLGYKLPETTAERQKFWKAVTAQANYWIPLPPEKWEPIGKKLPPTDT